MPRPSLSLAASQGASQEPALAPASPADRARLEAMFVEHLEVIDSVASYVCRRHRVSAADAEEFSADVRLKLVERDYEVLRRFEGRSSLRTYLTVVIGRMFLDYRNHLWGKWRPSAEARRLGPVAIRLETLMARDGLHFRDAAHQLIEGERLEVTEPQLLQIASRLPLRIRRVMVGEAALETATSERHADDEALLSERRVAAARLAVALRLALAGLPDQDRLILRLRFLEALSIADIARLLRLDSKPLYRRVEALFRTLRIALLSAGIDESAARDLLDHAGPDLHLALLPRHPTDAAAGHGPAAASSAQPW